ncbi:cytochrome C assembly family protein [Paenibacillus marinisediminis]
MVTSTWIYDAIIYTYALSLLFYFSDVVGVNRGAKRMGTGLLVFVWVMQTAFLVVRLFRHQDMPMFSGYEFMFLISWALVTASLVINRFFHIEFIVFFVNLFGFAVIIINMLLDPTSPSALMEWEMMRNILTFHVALAAGGFAVLMISAVYAGMYIFLHHRLKSRKWSDAVRRMPSLERIQQASLLAASIGVAFFLLSLSVAVGAVFLGGRVEILLDSKVLLTAVSLCLYGIYIVKRKRKKLTGLQVACFNLICFSAMLINCCLNSVSTFHRWLGV